MKKVWVNPEIDRLGVGATNEGPNPTEKHDMTTYDSNGNWWGGGKSQKYDVTTKKKALRYICS